MPSSVIRHHRYFAPEHRLDITFVSGRTYRYFAVPPALYARFRAASSKGAFFNARIRDRFECAVVEGDGRQAVQENPRPEQAP